MPNIDELIDLREGARDQDKLQKAGLPSEWSQSDWLLQNQWTCGTACCIAGKAVLDAGAQPIWEDSWDRTDLVKFNGKKETVRTLAREFLHITINQAEALFSASNKFLIIEYIIDSIIADPTWNWKFDTKLRDMWKRI